ncbi:hypothetical protein [Blautia sp.]|uniref:hypothetical protein n=1 Tax=Blautia sp. TaxID=1955243 RepID=UPI003AB7BF6A
MGRAELRRQAKSRKKEQEKISKVLKNAGFPEFQLPPAPLKTTNLSTQEVANITGTKIAVLEQWRKEQTEEIRKACIMEAQEKLDQAENFITLCNIITSLKALEGFRYAKAAAGYLLEHYSESVVASEKNNIQTTYKELRDKWGIDLEFEDPELNKEMGFEDANWMEEYIGRNIPYSVYEKIWDDSRNIQSVCTQLAVIWELCEEFGFAKHKSGSGNMLDKFMHGTKAKYDQIDQMKHGARDTMKLLKEKYDIDIGWTEKTEDTIRRFDL